MNKNSSREQDCSGSYTSSPSTCSSSGRSRTQAASSVSQPVEKSPRRSNRPVLTAEQLSPPLLIRDLHHSSSRTKSNLKQGTDSFAGSSAAVGHCEKDSKETGIRPRSRVDRLNSATVSTLWQSFGCSLLQRLLHNRISRKRGSFADIVWPGIPLIFWLHAPGGDSQSANISHLSVDRRSATANPPNFSLFPSRHSKFSMDTEHLHSSSANSDESSGLPGKAKEEPSSAAAGMPSAPPKSHSSSNRDVQEIQEAAHRASCSGLPTVCPTQLEGPAGLRGWLADRMPLCGEGNPLVDQWGVAVGTKRIANLWQEVMEGEIQLVDSHPPLRSVRVVSVKIRHAKTGKLLLEAAQEMADGAMRTRNRPLSEKMKRGENPLEACVRGIQEELGSALPAGFHEVPYGEVEGVESGKTSGLLASLCGGKQEGPKGREVSTAASFSSTSPRNSNGAVGEQSSSGSSWVQVVPSSLEWVVEERDSFSYPGLRSVYEVASVEALVAGLPEGNFWTEENEGGVAKVDKIRAVEAGAGDERSDRDRKAGNEQAVGVRRHFWVWVDE